MGQMLAVNDDKLDKQDRIDAVLVAKIDQLHSDVNRQSAEIKAGCERDMRLVDDRLRLMEKKMWTIAGAIAIISFVVSPIGQRVVGSMLTPPAEVSIIESKQFL